MDKNNEIENVNSPFDICMVRLLKVFRNTMDWEIHKTYFEASNTYRPRGLIVFLHNQALIETLLVLFCLDIR